jgi:multiple sugar transport system substrate-binding protein
MKKNLSLLCASAVLALGTVAGAVAAPVKISFMTWEPKNFTNVIAQYEKDTGNTVELVADDQAKLLAMGTAGDAIDVLEFHAGGQLMDLAGRGFLAPLDSRLSASKLISKADLLPINDLCRWDGSAVGKGPYYGVIKDYGSSVLWYNKRMFDKAGVAYPSATKPLGAAEFQALCKKLTVYKDGKVEQYGLAEPSAGTTWTGPDIGNMARAAISNGQAFGNYAFSQDNKKLSFDENSPGVLEFVTSLVDMARKDHSWPSPIDPSTAWAGDLFIHDKAALQIAGPWWVGWCELGDKEAKKYIGFAPAPLAWGAKQVFPLETNTGFAMMKGAKAEAFKLLEYLQYYGGIESAKIAWNLPSTKALAKLLPTADPYWKPYFVELGKMAKLERNFAPNPYVPDWKPLQDAMFGPNFQDLFSGKLAVKDWLKAGVAAVNDKLAEAVENR